MDSFKAIFKNIRHLRPAAVGLILGLLLLLLPQGHTRDEKEVIGRSYREDAEHRIAQMTDTLPGVDDVSVLVTMEEDGGADTVVGGQIPRVRGIAVTYVGDGGASVRLNILNLICAAYDISADRVWVGVKDAKE